MLDIVIISIGKMKDKNYSSAAGEYLKRLSPYAKIKLEELPAESFKTKGDKLKAKKIGGDRILSALNKYNEAEVFILDENGGELGSRDFAERIKLGETKKLVFVIGGTAGLSADVLNRSDFKFALSKMTVPHELAKVLLLEQIYRGVCINTGKQYHY